MLVLPLCLKLDVPKPSIPFSNNCNKGVFFCREGGSYVSTLLSQRLWIKNATNQKNLPPAARKPLKILKAFPNLIRHGISGRTSGCVCSACAGGGTQYAQRHVKYWTAQLGSTKALVSDGWQVSLEFWCWLNAFGWECTGSCACLCDKEILWLVKLNLIYTCLCVFKSCRNDQHLWLATCFELEEI